MANVSRPMQSIPQRLVDIHPEVGEAIPAGLESVREDMELSPHAGLPEIFPDRRVTRDSLHPTTSESIRDLLKVMRGRPSGLDAIGLPRQ